MSAQSASESTTAAPSGAQQGRSSARRLLRRWPMLLWLTLMWAVLWGDLSAGTLLAGVGVAAGCYAITRLPHVPVRLRFRPLHVVLLAGHIAFDLVTSSVRVAAHAVWRPERMRGAIVAVPMRTDSDLLLVMVTAGLSLITGSVVIELNRTEGVLYVHGTPIRSKESVRGLRRQVRRTEKRFVRAFGTADDIEEFERGERLLREAESEDAGEETR